MIKKIKGEIRSRNLVVGCTNTCSYCYARINTRRFKIIPDFSKPTFFENKLKLLCTKTPENMFLTGMSDFSDWKEEWISKTFLEIEKNKGNNFLFLTKSPEKIKFKTCLENAWMGVTVTNVSDKIRINMLKKNILSKHYFLAFEPLHEDVGNIDLDNIEWIVIGTETGQRRNKIIAQKDWIENILKQAKNKNIPVFMKEELESIVGKENMIQELPIQFMFKGN